MTKRVMRASALPDGVAVITDTNDRYYYTNETFKPIQSDDIYDSWSFDTVINVPQVIVAASTVGTPLGFRPGTLLASISDFCVYYISKRGKHKVVGTDFLKQAQRSPWNLPLASKRDLALHKTLEEIE